MGKASEEFNEDGDLTPKQYAFKMFRSVSETHLDDIVRHKGELDKANIAARLKEIQVLVDGIKNAEGTLSYEQDSFMVNVIAAGFAIRKEYGITESDIKAAILPYETEMGKKTAVPQFPRRFDL